MVADMEFDFSFIDEALGSNQPHHEDHLQESRAFWIFTYPLKNNEMQSVLKVWKEKSSFQNQEEENERQIQQTKNRLAGMKTGDAAGVAKFFRVGAGFFALIDPQWHAA